MPVCTDIHLLSRSREKNSFTGLPPHFGRVNIPSNDVWMSEMELVELFGVIAPTIRSAIRSIYKSETLCPVSTQRCDLATPASWATFYNLEMVIALAFRLNTYEASVIRQKVLDGICQRKENVRCSYWRHHLSIN